MAANSVEGQYVRGLPYCTAASPSVQHGTTSLPNGLPEAAELASRATSRQVTNHNAQQAGACMALPGRLSSSVLL